MGYPQEVKDIAYRLDPECWVSYSGATKQVKQHMESRRTASLARASAQAEQDDDINSGAYDYLNRED